MKSAYHHRLKMLEKHGSLQGPKTPQKMTRKASKRKYTSRASRERFIEMFVRQDGICLYCEKAMVLQTDLDDSATVDHLTPKSRGGTDARWNLGLACCRCNQDKGNRTYDEYIKVLQERESTDASGSL